MIADFLTDVNDTTNRKAEEVVYRTLQTHFRGAGVAIRDLRDLHLKWDFSIVKGGREYTIDVKCDHYIEGTQRFAFEMYHIYDSGDIQPSWGSEPRLDYVAVIPDTLRWIKVVPLQFVRPYVAMMERLYPSETLIEHKQWREIQKKNQGRGVGWTTYGWAIPMSGIERFCEATKAKIPTIETPMEVHQRTEPRLLIGGREVA